MSKFGNLVRGRIGAAVTAAANTITLAAPTAPYALPPADGGRLVLADGASNPTVVEIVSYTSRSGNVLQGVTRGREGTTARAWTTDGFFYQSLTAEGLQEELDAKVDKVAGKQLSTEDFTAAEKSKLGGIAAGAQVNTVASVAGKTGAVALVKGDVGLPNVDNTSDAAKPVSTAQQAALDSKLGVTATAVAAQKLATARTINSVAFDGTANITVADATKLPLTGGTLSGDLVVGATGRAANTTVKALAADGYNAGFEAYGSTQGTGYLYVGQDAWQYGGGIFYNGDAIPAFATGESQDAVSFYRVNAGAKEVVFSYPYNSNNVTFRGVIYGNGSGLTALNASNLASGTIPDARLSGTYTGVSITGNAATATKLATARTINDVSFDGTADIIVQDSTKEPAVTSGTTEQYYRGDKSWQDLPSAIRAAVLTGLSTAASTAVAASDSLLTAIGKLQAQVTGKVDKVAGKQLSTEDYTAAEKTKLSGIATGANNYSHPTGDGNLHVPATGTTNSGKVLTAGATAGSLSWQTPTVGTVTSVGGTGSVSGLTLSGTVSSSGNLTLGGTLAVTPANFASQAASSVLVAPAAAAGVPTFRNLELADIVDAWTIKSVKVATTANITLSAPQTIDGIALVAGDRVLVKNQSTAAQNGVYVVAAGAWTRALDASTSTRIAGGTVNVDSGTQGGYLFTTNFKVTDTIGTTAMNWYRIADTSMASTVVGSTPGTAAIGSSLNYARADHVHPVQTTVSGNAGTATALATARSISITGDAAWTTSFNGSANATGVLTLSNSGVTAGTYPKVTVDAKGRVTGGSALLATDIPTLNQSTTGNAATATKLATSRALTIGGSSKNFDGSAAVTWTLAEIGAPSAGRVDSLETKVAALEAAVAALQTGKLDITGGTITGDLTVTGDITGITA